MKELCNRLLEAESPVLCKAKEELENFIEGDNAQRPDRNIYTRVEWWYKRRSYIFCGAFVPLLSTLKINQAETIHASWVKRDRMNISLLDAAYVDGLDKRSAGSSLIQPNFSGNSKGGNGPSLKKRQDEARRSELKRAKSLGEDLIREDPR